MSGKVMALHTNIMCELKKYTMRVALHKVDIGLHRWFALLTGQPGHSSCTTVSTTDQLGTRLTGLMGP